MKTNQEQEKKTADGIQRIPKNNKRVNGTVPEPAGGGQAKNTAIDVHWMPIIQLNSWPDPNSKLQPKGTIPNLEHLLNYYGFTFYYNVITKKYEVQHASLGEKPIERDDNVTSQIISLCNKNDMPKGDVSDHLSVIGRANERNPVMDFIESKPWDGKSRFKDLLGTIETKPGYSRDLLSMLLMRWLISAVAAAAMPSGFWSKGVLVLQGAQSIGKTDWFKSLVPPMLHELIQSGITIDQHNKDTIISAVSCWLVELGELDGTMRKTDNAFLKGFISKDYDRFRRPYGRGETRCPRKTVFFASVNPEQFLTDETGNVRYWTIPTISLNSNHGIDMQQLWVEVFEWYRNDAKWWLDRDEEALLEAANENHQQCDPIEELILSRYGEAVGNRETEPMTATKVLLEIGYDRPTKAQLNVAAKALRKLFGDAVRTKKARLFSVPVIRDDRHQYREYEHQDESRPH